jgi:hypothetical protein
MAMKDRIRYFKTRTRGSVVHHLWSPGPHLRAAGWTEQRLDADETKAKAEAIAWNQKVDAWRAATGGVELPGDLCAPGTIKELVRDYKKSDEYKELSPKTRRGYAWDLDTIVQWAGSERAASITPKMVKTFYRSFVTANKRGRGNHVIGMVRGLYKWAISEDRVDVNPAHKDAITLKGTGAVPVIWTPEALAHMVRTAEAMGRASIADALIFNAWFGLRVDDLLGMKKSVYRDGAFIVATSKTGAVVNLPVDMVAELSARMTQHDPDLSAARGVAELAHHPDRRRGNAAALFAVAFPAHLRRRAADGRDGGILGRQRAHDPRQRVAAPHGRQPPTAGPDAHGLPGASGHTREAQRARVPSHPAVRGDQHPLRRRHADRGALDQRSHRGRHQPHHRRLRPAHPGAQQPRFPEAARRRSSSMNGVRYLVAKRRNGTVQYYWTPGLSLRTKGFRTVRLPDDLESAIEAAEGWNTKIDAAKEQRGIAHNLEVIRRPQSFKAGVYVLGTPAGPVKIGHSSNPLHRARELQVGNAKPIYLLGFVYMPDVSAKALERAVHEELASRRAAGEWFNCDAIEALGTITRVLRRLRTEHLESQKVGQTENASRAAPVSFSPGAPRSIP